MRVTFEEYAERLRDGTTVVVAHDVRALSSLSPEQSKALASLWLSIALPQRRKLVHLMDELAEDNVELDFNSVFKIALNDTDDEVRRCAAEGLWEDEEVATADRLVKVLRSDPAPDVRAAAATSLGHFMYRLELDDLDERTGGEVKQALYAAYDDQAETLDVRRRALESISYLSDERAHAVIAQAYADRTQKMRASALFAMGRSSDRRWLPAVLSELQSASAEMRFEAARASGELEDEHAVPMLAKLIGDTDREVRIAAIDAMGQIGGEQAKRVLRTVLEGTDEVLAEAAQAAIEAMEINEDIFSVPGADVNEN